MILVPLALIFGGAYVSAEQPHAGIAMAAVGVVLLVRMLKWSRGGA